MTIVDQGIRSNAKPGDVLAVLLPDGSEALVQVHINAACIGGFSKTFVRTNVLKPTGAFGILWYTGPTGERTTPFDCTLPVVSDPTHGQNWLYQPPNTFRILSWDELQPLSIIPLYRDFDAAHGAKYALYEYESDQGCVVAAKIVLSDAGYCISQAFREPKPFQYSLEIDRDHFRVSAPGLGPAECWTCQELIVRATQVRAARST